MARILLVDDEPSILSVLSTLLRAEGYEVVPALGGEKALEELKGKPFDLMISDIRMSPIDGMQLLKAARKDWPKMAVLMITAYGSVETAVGAMKAHQRHRIERTANVIFILPQTATRLRRSPVNVGATDRRGKVQKRRPGGRFIRI